MSSVSPPRSTHRNNSKPSMAKADLLLNTYRKDAEVAQPVKLGRQRSLSLNDLVDQGSDVDCHFHKAPNEDAVADSVVSVSEENKKSVKFGGTITIREHKLLISNSTWRNGPPITLSWEQLHIQQVDLDEFERCREGGRRLQKDLWASADDRRSMLKEVGGYSDEDLFMEELLRKAVSIPSRASSSSQLRRKVSK